MGDPSHDELVERVEALEAAVAELTDALDARDRTADRPSAPRSREAARFTDEYAIPTTIAVLEANIRALELLRRGIRAIDGREGSSGGPEHPGGSRRGALDELDRVIDRLADAVDAADLPQDAEARRLLEEAQGLNDEIESRIASASGAVERAAPADRRAGIAIDVESELEQIRDEVDGGDPGDEEPPE